jgi:hypothetical protein
MSERTPVEERALPSVFYNLWSLAGVAVAGVSLGLILLLTALEWFSDESHPYMGIVAFLVLPVFLLLGLGMVGLGVAREVRHRRRGEPSAALPHVDLNDPQHRRAILVVSVAAVMLAALSAFGSFQAYEYTDSDTFCGTVCHSVMHPEYTAYKQSPHARVECVKCHIGPGATWFVRSKLSGAYQMYAVLANVYPRPIPTPIENLRPSRDTCEQCHWPAAFLGEKFVTHDYYLSDDDNTHKRLSLLVKTGGAQPGGHHSGIHWHMALENEVYYFATDERRQQIPWVRIRRPDGSERVYTDTSSGFKPEDLVPGEVRRMDCLDCHNRPTHHFNPPSERMNLLLTTGRVDRTLPSVKRVAVEALDKDYASAQAAQAGIGSALRDFYLKEHPQLAKEKSAEIEAAVAAVQRVHRENFFPAMKASWKAYPDNKGHLYAPGCFRCHDGNHVTDDGVVLSRDCQLCHTLVARNEDGDGQEPSLQQVEFQHPVDIAEAWKVMNCSDCHGG